MAQSGVSDYTVTAGDIINRMFEELGVIEIGGTPPSEDSLSALFDLNLLLKQLMGGPKPACPSMKLWKRKRLTLDLTATAEYTVKVKRLAFTSGGTTAIAVGNTITGATSAATAKVMSVELTSGSWAGGDAAGVFFIEGQSGTFASENLDVGATANLATISGNSTQYGPPPEVISVVRRNSDGEDTPMSPMTHAEYMAIGDKDAEGSPRRYYIEKRVDDFLIFLDYKPDDTTDNLVLAVQLPLEDLDSAANNIDLPREWFRAIKHLLAQEELPKYPSAKDRAALISGLAGQAMGMANTFEPDEHVAYFEPDRDDD